MANGADVPKPVPTFITLPKVGVSLKEGEAAISSATLTKAKMRPYLIAFNLNRSGNRSEMLARLVEYSGDQGQWTK